MGKKSILLSIVGLLIIGGILAYNLTDQAVSKTDQEKVIVTIEQGSGTSSIASTLKEAGVIKSEMIFRLKSKIRGYDGKYQAGTYVFYKTMTLKQIMRDIADGNTAGQIFQVIEGQTIDKVADQLSEEGIVSKEEFYHEVENGEFDYPFMEYLPEGPTRLEGLLYPNTYEVALDATAHDVIEVMLKGFNDHIGSDYYEDAKKENEDIYQLIIKASIVEREASASEEKPKVSSVITNRLAINMPLQMDSIISYILKEDKIRATYSDIAVESDYNPYTNTGLPPGPICSPGKDAIDAALHPEDTEYLYFVASPEMDGTNVYSVKYDDFLVDKAAFDAAYLKYIEEHPGEE